MRRENSMADRVRQLHTPESGQEATGRVNLSVNRWSKNKKFDHSKTGFELTLCFRNLEYRIQHDLCVRKHGTVEVSAIGVEHVPVFFRCSTLFFLCTQSCRKKGFGCCCGASLLPVFGVFCSLSCSPDDCFMYGFAQERPCLPNMVFVTYYSCGHFFLFESCWCPCAHLPDLHLSQRRIATRTSLIPIPP